MEKNNGKAKQIPKNDVLEQQDSYSLRDKLMGFGERSIRKSYYPELQERLEDLERFRNLLDQTKDAIFLIEEKSECISDVNISASKLLNAPKYQIIGKKYNSIFPSSITEGIQGLFKTQEESADIQGRFPTDKKKKFIHAELNVKRVAQGDTTYGVVVARDITRRYTQEQAIRQSLNEKEVLLREIHHRVKNNLQIISSLLSLQLSFDKDKDAIDILDTAQRRIRAMSLVHEKLYQSENLAQINLYSYIKSLTQYLGGVPDSPQNVEIVVNIGTVTLSADLAIPCGMIVSELISNSLKHAFKDSTGGRIIIAHSFTDDGDHRLQIKDNGEGLPESFNPEATPSLGMRLVHTLAAQIKAQIEIDTSHGTCFTLIFPQSRY
ncbi:MAG: histidine kinase dimerization/phosphoacceptor domain -containing protein [Desulfovibrio sp.]|uniref:histidine kinase dimerization/phosphoacceptor domain -containing protein n=1 Tax=Desulfovibrio sp. 7SRBS1 TaxID=3378064 RepID=UPI003B3F5B0F